MEFHVTTRPGPSARRLRMVRRAGWQDDRRGRLAVDDQQFGGRCGTGRPASVCRLRWVDPTPGPIARQQERDQAHGPFVQHAFFPPPSHVRDDGLEWAPPYLQARSEVKPGEPCVRYELYVHAGLPEPAPRVCKSDGRQFSKTEFRRELPGEEEGSLQGAEKGGRTEFSEQRLSIRGSAVRQISRVKGKKRLRAE